MKRVLLSLALPILSLSACNKIEQNGQETAPRCEVTVCAAVDAATKASITPTADESKCVSVQFYAFRGDGLIDAYGANGAGASATLSCTTGQREFYALVNAPTLNSISTKSELLAAVSKLSDNSVPGLVMTGTTIGTLPDNKTLTIDVKRVAARIRISNVTRQFSAAGLGAKSMKITKIYVSNAAAQTNYGLTAAPTAFYNKTTTSTENPAMLSVTLDQSITNGGAYATAHSFYTYPNPGTSLKTRLVIVATIDGNTYYYPVEFPTIEANKSYEVEKVTITRLGSSDPQIPVSVQDIQVTVNVLGWDGSTMTETI